jgi:hypothetical protein
MRIGSQLYHIHRAAKRGACAALSGNAPGMALRFTGLPRAQLSKLRTNMTGEVVLVEAAQFCG